MYQDNYQKYRKAQIYDKLELQFPEGSTRMKADAIDISYGGIGLYSLKRIPVGREVIVSIGFLNTDDVIQFETVAGTVKWCRTQGFGFAAGIEFQGLDPHQHPRLVTFLQQNGPLREMIRHPEDIRRR